MKCDKGKMPDVPSAIPNFVFDIQCLVVLGCLTTMNNCPGDRVEELSWHLDLLFSKDFYPMLNLSASAQLPSLRINRVIALACACGSTNALLQWPRLRLEIFPSTIARVTKSATAATPSSFSTRVCGCWLRNVDIDGFEETRRGCACGRLRYCNRLYTGSDTSSVAAL